MATKTGSKSTVTVSNTPRGPLPELVQRMASSEDESSGEAGLEGDIVARTLNKKDLERLMQSQPADMLSDDDSVDSSLGNEIPLRTPDKFPDKNHNTKRPIPAEDSDDSDDDHFGV